MLIISYKMDIESLQIKNKYYYDCDDIIIYDFDFDIDLVKIFKRESNIDINIYYIGYKPDIDDTIIPLFFFVDRFFGFIEQIEGSNDRYLVVSTKNEIIICNDLYLPLDTLIEFHSLIINVSCVMLSRNLFR